MVQQSTNTSFYRQTNQVERGANVADANSVEFITGNPPALTTNPKRIWVDQAAEALKYTVNGSTIHTIADRLDLGFYNVKWYGALGNGVANDTASIQSAIDAANAAGGGTVYVPPGTYMIDALTSVNMKSNVTLIIDDGATLKAIGNSSSGQYGVIRGTTVSNIKVLGGKVQGERATHIGAPGESGHGIYFKGVTNFIINGVRTFDNRGDGIYIGGDLIGSNTPSSNGRVTNCTSDNNYRQGMSITHAKDILVQGNVFSNTNGTAPQSGVDVEPNTAESCIGIVIDGNVFRSNVGNGVELSGDVAGDIKAVISNNYSVNNTANGIAATITSKTTISGNTCEGNTAAGIRVANSNEATVTGNTVTQNGGNGILLTSSARCNVSGNTSTLSTNYGVQLATATNNNVSGNEVHNNGQSGILLVTGSSENNISNNFCHSNSTTVNDASYNIEIRSNCDTNAILGNMVRVGVNTNKPRRGIFITSADCDSNLVSNNDALNGGSATGITDSGTTTSFGAGNRNFAGTFSTTPS